MDKKYDVAALGELLIDFTENGISVQGNPVLEANPGGAPCNVLAMLKKLSYTVTFVGKVGQDMFGDQLEQALAEVGIDTSGLVRDSEVHTTLAFVQKKADGDRDFSFYRNPGADMMLKEEEVLEKKELIENCRIFHFGTLSMTHENCQKATKKAIEMAKAAGAVISFDPNLREPLWDSLDNAKKQVEYGLTKCNILKISDNEIKWLTDIDDYDEAVSSIQEKYPDISLILVSLGKEGSLAYSNKTKAFGKPFLQENTIETTGAGDTFCAGILHYVLEHGLKNYSEEELVEMLTFANAGASHITTKKGALRVMPDPSEVENLVSKRQ